MLLLNMASAVTYTGRSGNYGLNTMNQFFLLRQLIPMSETDIMVYS